jgi:hypothetical protein
MSISFDRLGSLQYHLHLLTLEGSREAMTESKLTRRRFIRDIGIVCACTNVFAKVVSPPARRLLKMSVAEDLGGFPAWNIGLSGGLV